MNLDRVEFLLSRLPVKHRETNISVPFVLNHNQKKAMEVVKKQYAEENYIRAVVLKARRVGISSWLTGLLFGHCLARSQAHAEIVAHLQRTSEAGLFRVPRDMALDMNKRAPMAEVLAKQIRFFHEDGDSILDIATAGSISSGRGLTLTALMLSEAAQYPGADSFLSLLPAVSKAPDTIIGIESTAFGRTGVGKFFYEFWKKANLRGRAWNGYVPIFLSWMDDIACVRNPKEASDAPASDLERELMNNFKASKAQIAWMRRIFEGECESEEPRFLQEYPHTPEVAFRSTGDPAFPQNEINYAISTKRPPEWRGSFYWAGGSVEFHRQGQGPWWIWEEPQKKCYYYLGADAAAGYETGDFAAIVILNGSTGKVAARLAEHIHPEQLAHELNMAGRHYNRGMVNIELTGNLGRWAQKVLRDDYLYPNFYIWKGKDDKIPGRDRGRSLGYETSNYSRGLLFDSFRELLRAGMKDMPGGLEPCDAELIAQMDEATYGEGLRWEVERGKDDILLAAMLATAARAQYPPTNVLSRTANLLDTPESKQERVRDSLRAQPELANALKNDLREILKPQSVRKMLEGI